MSIPTSLVRWLLRTSHLDGKAWVEQTLWQADAFLVGRRTYTDWLGYWRTHASSASSTSTVPGR